MVPYKYWFNNQIEKLFRPDLNSGFIFSYFSYKSKLLILLIPLVVIFGITLSIFIYFSHFESHYHDFLKSINSNEILVNCSKEVSKEKVRIDWKYSITKPKTIYQNSHQMDDNFVETGENIFIVYYDEIPEIQIIQYVKKDWLKHNYIFDIFSDKEHNIRVNCKIEGKENTFNQLNF